MGVSANPAQFVAKLQRATANMQAADRAAVRAAALAATTVIRGEVRQAVPSGRLSGVGRKGTRVSVGFNVRGTTNPTALITARGPLHLVENDTSPHQIPKERTARSRRASKRIRLADGSVRGTVQHPGTRGKKPFAKGKQKAQAPARAAFQGVVADSIRKAFN